MSRACGIVVQPEPRGTGDAVATARSALDGHARRRPRPLRRHAAPDGRPARGARRTAPLGRRRCHRALVRASGRQAPTGACSATRTARWRRSSRRGTRRPTELAVTEVNSSIYIFEPDALWAAIETLEPHNAQGELYLTDCVRAVVGRRRHGGACSPRPTGGRPLASTRVPSSPEPRPSSATA